MQAHRLVGTAQRVVGLRCSFNPQQREITARHLERPVEGNDLASQNIAEAFTCDENIAAVGQDLLDHVEVGQKKIGRHKEARAGS